MGRWGTHGIRRWAGSVVLALVTALAVVPAPAPAVAPPRAAAALLALAAQQPPQVVRVIVQATGPDVPLASLITGLGGTVRQDLGLIHAAAADLPAGAVPALAAAPGVRWVSPDAPAVRTACAQCIDTTNLQSAYVRAIRADQVWNEAPGYLQGQGVGVAIVDSGVTPNPALGARVVANQNFAGGNPQAWQDTYGHGTFVAGIVGDDGSLSGGAYLGIAPHAQLVNVRVSDDQGQSAESDVIAGLQWVHDHAAQYNIRVVNLSLNASVQESYNTSPLDAAVEILWFDGIVVVVSAGNTGRGALYAPANDPFVITVGATDDRGTPDLRDDAMASFSASGFDEVGRLKPDLVAPGTNVVGLLPSASGPGLLSSHPSNQVDPNYFRMSGTSVAAPMVAGAAALLLQDEPSLTPDQVKFRLKITAVHNLWDWPGYRPLTAGAGYLDVYAAVHGQSHFSANTSLAASQLLLTGLDPITWGSVSWNSVSWNSVSWNSVSWNSVSWNSVSWNSDYWGP